MPEVKRNKTTLRKAAKLLQAAHDRIEVTGFNISTYEPPTRHGQNADEFGGACCYIGNVRLVAGVKASPAWTGYDAGAGDGPELYLALEAMDGVAKRRLARAGGSVRTVKEEYEGREAGRFVEALGFEITGKFAEKFPYDYDKRREAEKNYALKLLRTALTEIYQEVENV